MTNSGPIFNRKPTNNSGEMRHQHDVSIQIEDERISKCKTIKICEDSEANFSANAQVNRPLMQLFVFKEDLSSPVSGFNRPQLIKKKAKRENLKSPTSMFAEDSKSAFKDSCTSMLLRGPTADFSINSSPARTGRSGQSRLKSERMLKSVIITENVDEDSNSTAEDSKKNAISARPVASNSGCSSSTSKGVSSRYEMIGIPDSTTTIMDLHSNQDSAEDSSGVARTGSF